MRICCETVELTNYYVIKGLGIFCVLLGAILICEDGSGFGYVTKRDVGDWWFAIPIILTGLLGFYSSQRRVMFVGLIFSFLAILATIAGTSVNSRKYYHEFKNMEACVSSHGWHQAYGPSHHYVEEAGKCLSTHVKDQKVYDCYCVSHSNSECYSYNLLRNRVCGEILTTHRDTLLASIVMGIACLVVLVLFFAISFVTLHTEDDITSCCDRPIKRSGVGVVNHNAQNGDRASDLAVYSTLKQLAPIETRPSSKRNGYNTFDDCDEGDRIYDSKRYDVSKPDIKDNLRKAHELFVVLEGKAFQEEEDMNDIDGEESESSDESSCASSELMIRV